MLQICKVPQQCTEQSKDCKDYKSILTCPSSLGHNATVTSPTWWVQLSKLKKFEEKLYGDLWIYFLTVNSSLYYPLGQTHKIEAISISSPK